MLPAQLAVGCDDPPQSEERRVVPQTLLRCRDSERLRAAGKEVPLVAVAHAGESAVTDELARRLMPAIEQDLCVCDALCACVAASSLCLNEDAEQVVAR